MAGSGAGAVVERARRAERAVRRTLGPLRAEAPNIVAGAVDPVRLRRADPCLAAAVAGSASCRAVLAEAHHEYTTSVSTPVMAVSLETAALLWSICEAVRPDRILDLGSGFSTYVFGRWSNERGGARVVSVDSDEFWLGQTTAWLQSLGVDGPELRLLGDPFPSDNDVVFLDLGETTTRIGYLADAFASLDGAGVLVIDDMHHHPFGRQVRAGAKWSDMRLFSLRRQARDSYGRFPAVAVRG